MVSTMAVQRHLLERVYLLRQCGGGRPSYVYKLLKGNSARGASKSAGGERGGFWGG